ncbi:hypothetical protein J27TS8_23900 [Robertmurraya siralis]|uniref:Uncharacterized protein n=1 Tax=Robertmurraya siralis TaxID=77777 RepID=A0A919WIL6_9BACI|nr:hypothetical protein [Robertmurraya siralis]GIN62397.1 hypothetical protein J27TS8_23900 [Robertmurraya siralis]
MKRLNNKKFLLLLSFLVTIIIAFVPGIGIRVEEPSYYFGFPAEFLGYHGKGLFSYPLLGFLFNIIFYYIIFLILIKATLKIKKYFLKQ